jgi:hypothetical protein
VVIKTKEINISILSQEGVENHEEEAIKGKISTRPMNTSLNKPSLLVTLKLMKQRPLKLRNL